MSFFVRTIPSVLPDFPNWDTSTIPPMTTSDDPTNRGILNNRLGLLAASKYLYAENDQAPL